MPKTGRNRLLALAGVGLLLLAGYLYAPVERFRLDSPGGNYTATVSSHRLWQLLRPFPFLYARTPGHIHIHDKDGRSLGSIPVPRTYMAHQLRWIEQGAHLRKVGAWNFHDGFYAYWNRAKTQLVLEKIH